jgi:hypothetical protein
VRAGFGRDEDVPGHDSGDQARKALDYPIECETAGDFDEFTELTSQRGTTCITVFRWGPVAAMIEIVLRNLIRLWHRGSHRWLASILVQLAVLVPARASSSGYGSPGGNKALARSTVTGDGRRRHCAAVVLCSTDFRYGGRLPG